MSTSLFTSEFRITLQRFQSKTWYSSNADRQLILSEVNRKVSDVAKLNFQQRYTCYQVLKIIEQHEVSHLSLWVRIFEWVVSKIFPNFCTKSHLISQIQQKRSQCETLYSDHPSLPAADLKELQKLNPEERAKAALHLQIFSACLTTPAQKALNTAIKMNQVEVVKQLFNQYGASTLLKQEYQTENSLQLAWEQKNYEIIEFLLQAGAKTSVPNVYGQTFLHCLESKLYASYIPYIIQQISIEDLLAALKVVDMNNETPLSLAIRKSNNAVLQAIFKRFERNKRQEFEQLLQTSKHEIVQALNSFKVKPLPLINKLETFQLDLLKSGDLSWIEAAEQEDFSLIYYFFERDLIDFQAKSSQGQTVLHLIASSKFTTEIYEKFIRRGIDRGNDNEALDHQGQTALNLAAYHNNMPMLRALLNAGANVDVIGDEQHSVRSPLYWMLYHNDQEMVLEILSKMKPDLVEMELTDDQQSIISKHLNKTYERRPDFVLNLLKNYPCLLEFNLSIVSKVSPKVFGVQEDVEKWRNIVDQEGNTIFHIAAQRNLIEWFKILSPDQLVTVIQDVNGQRISVAQSFRDDTEAYKYVLNMAEKHPDLQNFSDILNIRLTQGVIDNQSLLLIQTYRDSYPNLFKMWLNSSAGIKQNGSSRWFKNPILMTIALGRYHYLSEILLMYDREFEEIFNCKGEKDVIDVETAIQVKSLLEDRMQKEDSWLGKLKWLEVRMFFANHLDTFDIPYPNDEEEFRIACERDLKLVEKVVGHSLICRDWTSAEQVITQPSIFAWALQGKHMYVINQLNRLSPAFLLKLLQDPDHIEAIVVYKRLEVFEILTKNDALSVAMGVTKSDAFNEYISSWPKKVLQDFLNVLKPDEASTPSYRRRLQDLFKQLNHSCNLLYAAIEHNCLELVNFIHEESEPAVFRGLLKQTHPKNEWNALQLSIKKVCELDLPSEDQREMLRKLLTPWPDVAGWLMTHVQTVHCRALSDGIIYNEIADYLVKAIHSSRDASFSITLFELAELLKLDDDIFLSQINIDSILKLLSDSTQFERFYAKYSSAIDKIFACKDVFFKNILHRIFETRQGAEIVTTLFLHAPDKWDELMKERDYSGSIPLHYAPAAVIAECSRCGFANLKNLLLTKNLAQETPLERAERFKSTSRIQAFLKAEIEILIHDLKHLYRIQGTAEENIKKIEIVTGIDALKKQKMDLTKLYGELRSVIQLQQKELRKKNEKAPLILPSTDEIQRLNVNASYMDKATLAVIPKADSKIKIKRLITFFDKIYSQLPSQIVDDGASRSKAEVRNRFIKYINIFDSHSMDIYKLNEKSKSLINNILRHIVSFFERQEQVILKTKDLHIKQQLQKTFEGNLKTVLGRDIALAFFHCIDRINTELEDTYMNYVAQDSIGKTLDHRLYIALLLYRRDIFHDIVANLKTGPDKKLMDPHAAATHRYYRTRLTERFRLGDAELSSSEGNYESYALGHPLNPRDANPRDAEIIASFDKSHTAAGIIARTERLFAEGALPTEALDRWFTENYQLTDEQRTELLSSNGQWNTQAIAVFLSDPSIDVLGR